MPQRPQLWQAPPTGAGASAAATGAPHLQAAPKVCHAAPLSDGVDGLVLEAL